MQEELPNFEADSEHEGTLKRAIFEAESIRPHYTQATDNNHNEVGVKMLSHTSGNEIACHF